MQCLAICGGKVPFSRRQAKLRLDAHQRSLCPRCRSGLFKWNRYPCSEGGVAHFHVGHQYVARGRG